MAVKNEVLIKREVVKALTQTLPAFVAKFPDQEEALVATLHALIEHSSVVACLISGLDEESDGPIIEKLLLEAIQDYEP